MKIFIALVSRYGTIQKCADISADFKVRVVNVESPLESGDEDSLEEFAKAIINSRLSPE